MQEKVYKINMPPFDYLEVTAVIKTINTALKEYTSSTFLSLKDE